MTRVRLALIVGSVLLLGACALPCGSFLNYSAESLPYQDATKELLEKQAEAEARLDRQFRQFLVIGAGLAVIGIGCVIYGLRQRSRQRRLAQPDLPSAGAA